MRWKTSTAPSASGSSATRQEWLGARGLRNGLVHEYIDDLDALAASPRCPQTIHNRPHRGGSRLSQLRSRGSVYPRGKTRRSDIGRSGTRPHRSKPRPDGAQRDQGTSLRLNGPRYFRHWMGRKPWRRTGRREPAPTAHPGAMPPTRYWYRWRKKGPAPNDNAPPASRLRVVTKNCVAGGHREPRLPNPNWPNSIRSTPSTISGVI